MKRIITILLTMLLIVTLIGCKKENKTLMVETETVYVDNTEKLNANEANPQVGELEQLSEEDKAVKAEIAKYSDTTIDFRKNKQEKIQGKDVAVSFSEVKTIAQKQRVVYTNDLGDEFMYSADNGKLFLARLDSNLTEKTEKSIDKKTAQEIAEKYIADNCDTNELKLSLHTQTSECYFFEYSKYVFGYKTNATFEIKIGFDGAIIYIRNNTDVLDEVEITVNKEWFEQKIAEYTSKSKDKTLENVDVYISVENKTAFLCFGRVQGDAIGIYKCEIK